MIYHGFDASRPPSQPYPGTSAAFGYLGGNTPHVWTIEEWLDATDNGTHRCGGIWVADFTAPPGVQAEAACAKAVSLGWYPHAIPRRCIVLDSETSHDVAFIRDFADSCSVRGFVAVDYRSVSALLAAPSGLDEFVARWDVAAGPFTPQQIAFQYQAGVAFDGASIDLDAFDTTMWHMLGRGPRHNVIHPKDIAEEFDTPAAPSAPSPVESAPLTGNTDDPSTSSTDG